MLRLQTAVSRWCASVLRQRPEVQVDIRSVALHLLEEALESCLEAGCSGTQISREVYIQLSRQAAKPPIALSKNSLGQELSNVLLVLLRLAHLAGVDLEKQAEWELKSNMARSWEVLDSGDLRKRS